MQLLHRGAPVRHRLPFAAQPTAVAVDIGSSAVRLWSDDPGRVCIRELVPRSAPGRVTLAPLVPVVDRGAVMDPASCASVVRSLLDEARQRPASGAPVYVNVPLRAERPDVVRLRSALGAAFHGHPIELVPATDAVAAYVRARLGTDDVVVVDVGHGLTEAALLVDGAPVCTWWAEIGVADLGTVPGDLPRVADGVAAVVNLALSTAVERGVEPACVLTGGGSADPVLPGVVERATGVALASPPGAARATLLGLAALAGAPGS